MSKTHTHTHTQRRDRELENLPQEHFDVEQSRQSKLNYKFEVEIGGTVVRNPTFKTKIKKT